MAEVNINFKPNSNKYKAETKEREKITPVIKAESIVSTKKSFAKKALGLFFGDNVRDLKDFIIQECIVPGIQDFVLDTLEAAFGRKSGSRSYRRDEPTSYSSFYRGSSNRSRSFEKRDQNEKETDYRDVILIDRYDAEKVVEHMRKRIHDTGNISIAEFFDLLNLPSKWTDNDWGWDREGDVGIRETRKGFLIDVREAKRLD